jgi:hypothetical protein
LNLNIILLGTNLEDPSNGIAADSRDAEVAYSKYEKKVNDIVR